MRFSPVKRLTLAAVCTALCVVLPMAFHGIPNGGSIFLPMHIPVLLCGLVCGWPYGAVCGLLGPLLSCLVTSMPPLAYLPSMMAECCVYGAVCGLMMKFVRTGHTNIDLYASLVTAMLLGRVVSGLYKSAVSGTPPFAWVTTSLVTGIPGIVLQLVLMPLLVYALMRAKAIPYRYPKETVHE